MLDEIDRNHYLGFLFEQIWEKDSPIAKLLCAHHNQLFPYLIEEPVKLQMGWFHWDNICSALPLGTSVLEIEHKLSTIEKQDRGGGLQDKLWESMRDLIAYYAVRLFRENKELKELVTSERFDFQRLRKAMGDYSTIVKSWEAKLEELNNIESIEDTEVQQKIGGLSKLEWFDTKSLFPNIFMLTSSVEGATMTFALVGHGVKENIMTFQGLTPEEYTRAIETMYMLNAFSKAASVFWCENCRDERLILTSHHKITPSHTRLNCPKCQRPMFAALAFMPSPQLLQCLESKDGILSVALAYLLRKNNIEYSYSVRRDSEIDFLCHTPKGIIIIECKMHRTDAQERGIRDNLTRDLKQLLDQYAQNKDSKTLACLLVVNYSTGKVKELADKILDSSDYRKYKDECGLKIVSYDSVPNLLKELS